MESAARSTQFNWVITGVAALLNIVLNVALIPPYGMMGAAIATVVAYLAMFIGMTWSAQRVAARHPVAAASGGLTVAGKLGHASLPVAITLATAFPLVLAPLGFYLPSERERLRRLVPIWSA